MNPTLPRNEWRSYAFVLLAWASAGAMTGVTLADQPATSLPAADGRVATPVRHAAPRRTLDDDVQRLSRQLQLTTDQQAQLRAILVDEKVQIREVWMDNPDPEGNRTGPTLAIIDRTQTRIRAMLTDEQKSRYPAAVSRNQLAPASADVASWLKQLHPAASQAQETGK